MDQNEGNKWDMPWYDWLVFLVPTLLIVGLGLESALGPEWSQVPRFPGRRALV